LNLLKNRNYNHILHSLTDFSAMVKHFKNSLFAFALLAVSSLFAASYPAEVSFSRDFCMRLQADALSNLQVTQTSPTAVSLSWTGTGTNFRVTVTNLTTQQMEQSFTVSTTSASVSSLTSGHTYRFEVEQNGYVIAEDLIM
jgi:hypothetical protein